MLLQSPTGQLRQQTRKCSKKQCQLLPAHITQSQTRILPCRGTPVCNFVEPNLTTYISAPACVVNPDPKAKHIKGGGRTQQVPSLTVPLIPYLAVEVCCDPWLCDEHTDVQPEALSDGACVHEVELPHRLVWSAVRCSYAN